MIGRRGLLSLIVFLVIFSSVGNITGSESNWTIAIETRDYAQHEPIRINSGSDMDAMAYSEGWSGSGTLFNPYIIENYEIDAHGGAAFFVGNTTKYFLLRYSHFYNSTSSTAGAVVLYNVDHGYIHYNNISDSIYGVHISHSSTDVDNNYNTFYNLTYGTYVFRDCQSITTSRNEYIWVRNPIKYIGVSGGIISFNTMANSVNVGVMLDGNSYFISDIKISRNVIETGSSSEGIYLYGFVSNCRVENNTVKYSQVGIRLYSGVSNTIIANNTLYHSRGYGVSIAFSSDTTVYNNSFVYCNGATDTYNSAHIQAYSNGTNNVWYYKGYGNYWNDWTAPDNDGDGIVDNPYSLAGDPGVEDKYPLVGSPTNIPEFWGISIVFILILLLALFMRRRERDKNSPQVP